MFKATLNSIIFRDMIEAINAVASECRLHIDDDGIHVITVDTANVAMVVYRLKNEAFEDFKKDIESLSIGIDIERIRNVLRGVKLNKSTIIEIKDNYFIITCADYEYSIRLLDEKTIKKDPREPFMDLPVSLTMSGELFTEIINAIDLVDEKAYFVTLDNELIIYGKSEGSNLKRVLKPEQLEYSEVSFDKYDDVKSLFSMNYLKDMSKNIKKAENIHIELGIDRPIVISYDIADSNGYIKYVLAPRIEAE